MCCHPQAGREQARCPPALTISRWIAATNAISNVSDDAIRSLRWSRSPIFKHTLLRYGAGRLARSFVQDQPTAPGGRRSLAQATAITAEQRSAASVDTVADSTGTPAGRALTSRVQHTQPPRPDLINTVVGLGQPNNTPLPPASGANATHGPPNTKVL